MPIDIRGLTVRVPQNTKVHGKCQEYVMKENKSMILLCKVNDLDFLIIYRLGPDPKTKSAIYPTTAQ